VRRRSLTGELQQRLTKKRQLYTRIANLEARVITPVLLRDPTESAYPFADQVAEPNLEYPAWLWTGYEPHSKPDEVALVFRRHHAWLSADDKSYDVLEFCSHVVPHRNGFDYMPDRDKALCERAWTYCHNEVPVGQRGWLLHVGFLPIDEVLLVDDLGDAMNDPPHLLAERGRKHGYFTRTKLFLELERHGVRTAPRELMDTGSLTRARLFPDPIPDVEWR